MLLRVFSSIAVIVFVFEILFFSLLMAFGGVFFSSPEDDLDKADIIVILGGGTAGRLNKGMTLYKQGVAVVCWLLAFQN